MPAAIHFNLRQDWRELKRGRPGRRFQDRYERARRTRRSEPQCGLGKRICMMVVAVVAIAAGVFFAIFPGPAVPFFLVGGALLATESRPIARAMDWLELRFRAVFAWAKRHWRRWPVFVRVILMVLGVATSATTAYLLFRFIRR